MSESQKKYVIKSEFLVTAWRMIRSLEGELREIAKVREEYREKEAVIANKLRFLYAQSLHLKKDIDELESKMLEE